MSSSAAFQGKYYTLERDVRELQPRQLINELTLYYTLERDVRELQQGNLFPGFIVYYTLERDVRELQPLQSS